MNNRPIYNSSKQATWRNRMMHRFGMDVQIPLRKDDLVMPNWLNGRSIAFFFVAILLSWGVFGHVPGLELIMVTCLSIVLFFYGGMSMAKSWSRNKEKTFLKNTFVAGFVIRMIWVLYLYYIFNPDHFGNTYGDTADTDWYISFGKQISQWISGDSNFSLSQIMDMNGSAIDDVGYPFWLGLIYFIVGVENDIFIPFLIKVIMGAYCSICIYRIAQRHYGEGVARMAAIFVCVNPNIIYWCGSMMKEAEMVFFCCLSLDYIDRALTANKQLTIKSLLPGVAIAFAIFFFRAPLAIVIFLATFAHIVMASNRVMSAGKKIIAGVMVGIVLLVGMGDRLRTQTEAIVSTAQSDAQKENMEWRSRRQDGGNTFAKYASAAVFAPLIFTIPFPTFNMADEGQLLQMQLSGGYYIKNIFSFFVIWVMIVMLLSGEWRRHVFIIAYTVGYLVTLVLSSFAQSGRFHMPIWPMLMLFAAYGIQLAKTNPRMRRWFPAVLVFEVVACLAWNWFKLKGRGMI